MLLFSIRPGYARSLGLFTSWPLLLVPTLPASWLLASPASQLLTWTHSVCWSVFALNSSGCLWISGSLASALSQLDSGCWQASCHGCSFFYLMEEGPTTINLPFHPYLGVSCSSFIPFTVILVAPLYEGKGALWGWPVGHRHSACVSGWIYRSSCLQHEAVPGATP